MPLSRTEMIAMMSTPDGRADGRFIVGVKTTGIYCLPSCRPPRSPKPENVAFYATPVEARAAGLRACRLCHPDRVPHTGEAIERRLAYIDTVGESPGPLTFAVDDQGALIWLQFLDGHYPRTIDQEIRRLGFHPEVDASQTAHTTRELREYCQGERRTFTLPLHPTGTAWQQRVWQALAEIPFGETRTYGQVAASLGRPGAARAMGRANATNPISLVIPCHRVVGANGALTGYGGGLHIKQRLLEHEARVTKSRSRGVEKAS